MTNKLIQPNRRTLLKGGLAATAASAFPLPLYAQDRPLKVGYVSPQTGPLAVFGETDNFILDGVRKALAGGIQAGGRTREVEIIVKDSQSSSSRAASVAAELIESDGVNLMLVTATPDTTNPVADQCELAEIPCASTAAPWEAWYFGRGGTPDAGFDYTYHFFFGLAEALNTYAAMWNRLDSNKVVGGLFPNDADGAAWADPKVGAPGLLPGLGYDLINPGTFQNGTDNFTAHISAFNEAEAEILTGVLNPPDWNTFWRQARQQGLRPKAATIGKALVFPAAVQTLGDLADGLTMEIVWAPNFPFASGLTGRSSAQLAADWTAASGKAWTPPLGWTQAIFDVGINALATASDPDDAESVNAALAATDIVTTMGPVNFSKGPFGRNVSITPLVGGQWAMGGDHGIKVDIVANDFLPDVPLTADLRNLRDI
ncbi:ABC transporter substrate-binding protein [Frigidibacter sp. SD6-1]|uniref:ABC transporter substrate-binding protein n=1 Tax=Frigidibacter sp. SD6-1 TaxID=3032581 RepID=UPI0024DFEDFC|nr:ABC transporter substrate-binding protein [Frigidibacter sp. SD6-1]